MKPGNKKYTLRLLGGRQDGLKVVWSRGLPPAELVVFQQDRYRILEEWAQGENPPEVRDYVPAEMQSA